MPLGLTGSIPLDAVLSVTNTNTFGGAAVFARGANSTISNQAGPREVESTR